MIFKQFDRITIWLFLALAISFAFANFIGPKNIRQNFIDGDGSGHYAYLPAICIYQTVDFTPIFNAEKAKRSLDYQGHYFHKTDGILINKYSSGTALLQLPFFLLAWLASVILGIPADGYTVLFQYSVAFSAVFYVFLGLLFFIKLSLLYGVNKKHAAILALIGLFGTNLFFYTFLAPSLSHAYSFSLISAFLYFMKKSFLNYSGKSILISAFVLGLIVLVRPVNLVVLASIPFLTGSPKELISSVKEKIIRIDIFPAALLFLLALSPQLIINFLQTGNIFVLGYKNEGFYFDNPEIVNFLFSYRKGWFVYTPLMLLIIPALIALYKRTKYEFFSFLLFFFLLIYVFSSWWNWLYGDSFGMRPMVDFYALFLLIIVLFAENIKKKAFKVLIILFIGVTVFLNLFQTFQYSKGILHPDSMTKEAYWYVFLKSDNAYSGVIGDYDEYFYGTISEKPFLITQADLQNPKGVWSLPSKTILDENKNRQVVALDINAIFSPSFKIHMPDSLLGMKNLYVIFKTDYLEIEKNSALNCLFVVDISKENGELLFYKTFRLKRLPDEKTNKWTKGRIGFKLPEIKPDMEKITLYIWNKNKQQILLDSLEIGFYAYTP